MSHNKKITNRKQFEALISFMEQYPNFAKGAKYIDNKAIYKKLSYELSVTLNTKGPPVRNKASEWIKVWTDWKLKIKQKMLHNKKVLSGSGGQRLCTFTPQDEGVIALLNLEETVYTEETVVLEADQSTSIGQIEGDGPLEEDELLVNKCGENDEMDADEEGEPMVYGNVENKNFDNISKGEKHKRKDFITGGKKLLEQQTEYLKEINKNTRKKAHYTKKTYEIQKEKLNLMKKEFKKKEEFRRELRKVQLRDIEYKEKTLSLLLQYSANQSTVN